MFEVVAVEDIPAGIVGEPDGDLDGFGRAHVDGVFPPLVVRPKFGAVAGEHLELLQVQVDRVVHIGNEPPDLGVAKARGRQRVGRVVRLPADRPAFLPRAVLEQEIPGDGGFRRIDGHDLRTFKVQSLRDQVSMVLQDALLFSGSIRDNIAFGKPEATMEEIVASARTANADEFIDRLPLGYETAVSERGTTLSGGQKQRIAIARAILRNAPILILDEPTTGLDAVSERLVVEALERAAQGRTTVTIAHRLTTLRFADRIIVLEGGKIVEEGTHLELVRRRGRYASFFNLHTGAA